MLSRTKTKICLAAMAACLPLSVAVFGSSPEGASRAPVIEMPHWGYGYHRNLDKDEIDRLLVEIPDPERLRRWHDLLAERPHRAGTPGDEQVVDRLVEIFESMGLKVERHPFWAYLPEPVDAAVQILSPDRLSLAVTEPAIDEDRDTAHPELDIGWNAWSGSGDVAGRVVYANYGTIEDFEKLQELGVDVEGAIVIARYGRGYRGHKAKFAEAAGAAGLILYTDPMDSGYMRGLVYPEGGWAAGWYIQSGSLKTLPWAGDALTPGYYAGEDVERLDPDDLDLPRIPVQPIGYDAAHEILKRMNGPGVPSGWQGGLPLAYRVTGGDELRVRVMVEQRAEIRRQENVIATLKGSHEPDRFIVVGGHHDAWGHGAGDPLAGTICILEAARTFSELAERGMRPGRSIVFAAWGAEEYGLIGSTEWVEERMGQGLRDNCIAYINLDMSAMGPRFRASSSPSLRRAIAHASTVVPTAGNPDKTVYEDWMERGADAVFDDEPRIGDLGGGSDHVPFWFHAGVPSAGFGAGPTDGVSYHSNADTLTWYRQIVGEDYESALMVTRMTNATVARLANLRFVPLSPARDGVAAGREADRLTRLAIERGVISDGTGASDGTAPDREQLRAWVAVRMLGEHDDVGHVIRWMEDERIERMLKTESRGIAAFNRDTIERARSFIDDEGLAGREWYKNFLISTNPNTGYGNVPLPSLRDALDAGDGETFWRELVRLNRMIERSSTPGV